MAIGRVLLVRFLSKSFNFRQALPVVNFIAIVNAEKHLDVFLSIVAQCFESLVNLYRHTTIEGKT